MSRLKTARNLLTQVGPWQCNHAAEYGVRYKRLVVHQFVRRECRYSVEEKTRRQLEVTHGHAVRAAVDLESIAAIPVTSFIYQPISKHTHQSPPDQWPTQDFILGA